MIADIFLIWPRQLARTAPGGRTPAEVRVRRRQAAKRRSIERLGGSYYELSFDELCRRRSKLAACDET